MSRMISVERGQFFTPTGKYYDAFPADGVGDVKPITPNTALLLTTDNIADDTSTTDHHHGRRAARSSRPSTPSATRISSGSSWSAGQIYDIGQYLKVGGPSGVPLPDAYIEIYDAAGNLLTSADGGGPEHAAGPRRAADLHRRSRAAPITSTPAPSIRTRPTAPPATASATTSCSSTTSPGGPTLLQPYYDIDSPLHSIDWGTQVDRTSRNPDGDEGPRVTGNAFTGVG